MSATAQPAIAAAATAAAPAIDKRVYYFTDRLSAELRICIYEHVFGPAARAQRIWVKKPSKSPDQLRAEDERDIVTLSGSIPPAELQMIDTNIFAVNRLIHNESIEAFYDNKIISASFVELGRLFNLGYPPPLFRDVEIKSCHLPFPSGSVRSLLQKTSVLSRLRSLTIRSDYLARTRPESEHTTVRQFVESNGLGNVICTDIGKFTLTGRFSNSSTFGDITFINNKILQMWPRVAQTPDDFNVHKEVWDQMKDCEAVTSASNLLTWATHRSLRLWIGMIQRCALIAPGGSMEDIPIDEAVELVQFCESVVGTMVIPIGIPIHKLGPTDHPEILEEVTEMVAENIQTYRVDGPEGTRYREPRWVELGCECELSRQSRYQIQRKKSDQE
ncbi:uncharacterized protein RCC_00927 [Ramularia collo-cygni]|uniref:Uncharacterized protein n=1 Tax=Ramularia collo-cygni TaxID=112498 RepID=A0A2D3UXZ8_9PEZI|nr:uncharacterized protein RCC_00927 [Ramularia collo-cygni]CZT15014.1 uncharacterized protein RCC_00927 [Ramularia collo-cygni]